MTVWQRHIVAPVSDRWRLALVALAVCMVLWPAWSIAQDDPPVPASEPVATQPTTQPASAPASAPASQPQSAPSSQPATAPASQPATAPVSQPASHPASSQAHKAKGKRPASTSTSSASTSTQAAEEEKERFLAVIDGRVHTVTGPTLDRATVLSRNGVLTEIGTDVVLPPDCQVIDAQGMEVYPGLVAASTSGIFAGNPPQDFTDVYSLSMLVALAGGITTALAGNDVAKLTFGTAEDMILRANAFVGLNYNARSPLERAQIRADLERVRSYLRDVQRYERQKATDKDAKAPDKDWLKDRFEVYRKLLEHQAVGVVTAQTAYELRAIAELAENFDIDVVVRGAHEGWTVAPLLGRAHLRAVIVPRENQYPDERLNRPTGSAIENARILRDAGVPVAVVPTTAGVTFWGLAGRDLLQLNLDAAFAVRGGLSNDDAVRTITIDAARVLGVDDRVGSLEVGKDADLIVCDGDLLHYMTQVRYTVVNGRLAYDKAKAGLYSHIRPSGKREAAQFDDLWPRRLAWPED